MKQIFTIILFFSLGILLSCSEEKKSQIEEKPALILEKSRVYNIAILDSENQEPYQSARAALLKTLNEMGLKEGQTLSIDYKNIDNDDKKASLALKEAISKKPDVIVTNGTIMTLAAKKSPYFNNPDYQFVFVCVTDPVGIGVIEGFGIKNSYNFTGVSYPVPVDSRLKFIQRLMPDVKKIGLIYADMPQSESYRQWILKALRDNPELKNIQIIFRSVPLITGVNASMQMSEKALKYVKELDPLVDVFISPNDQMGVQKPFAAMVYQNASKPLIGIGKADVMDNWGAFASIYPSHETMGIQAGEMVMKIFSGIKTTDIPAEWPRKNGFAFDLKKAEKFNIKIPVSLIELAEGNIIQ
ncbi:MAG TPA: hypothetical protein DHW82_11645 [Spirochaetia bacterium]|nr:MAG: hypothetical protein A2Y41_09565 [Spirochaetes bacterium GWB1_36_13]HCL57645.1 hypothetical protein [Spirochaetia bacterium]